MNIYHIEVDNPDWGENNEAVFVSENLDTAFEFIKDRFIYQSNGKFFKKENIVEVGKANGTEEILICLSNRGS